MGEKLTEKFWVSLREKTRANRSIGGGKCQEWVEDAIRDGNVSPRFVAQRAELGEIQIDQLATSILFHCWLESLDGTNFIADGTAGQYDPQYPQGFYGYEREAPEVLRVIYSKKI